MADSNVKRRGGIRGTITNDINKIKPMLDGSREVEVPFLRAIKKKLEHNLNRLYELDEKIQEDSEEAIAESERINDHVLSTVVRIEECIVAAAAAAVPSQNAPSAQTGGTQPSPVQPLSASIRLPKFEMGTYKGDPMGWQAFWDVYKAAIHDNRSITPVEKFSYLLGYLADDALSVAKGYSLTEANYDQVITALQERFGDKERARFAHIMALIEVEKAKGNNLSDLRRVSDQCELHIRSLVALELEEDTFGFIFTAIILSKLPQYLMTELCRKNGRNTWELQKVRDWIKEDIRAREMGEASMNGSKNEQNARRNNLSQRMATSTYTLPAPAGNQRQRVISCLYCDRNGHWTDECRRFGNYNDRKSHLRENNKCFRCLAIHPGEPCKWANRSCVYCQKSGHHRSICPVKFLNNQPRQDGQYQNSQRNWNGQNSQRRGFQGNAANKDSRPPAQQSEPKKNTTAVTVTQMRDNDESNVSFLQTAITQLEDESGGTRCNGRLLMDPASSRTYVTQDMCEQLGLETVGKTYISVGRFGTTRRATKTANLVRLNVICKDGSIQPVVAAVTPVITCPIDRTPIDPLIYPIVKDLQMAEPLNDAPDSLELDVLIGSDQYYNFMSPGNPVRVNDLVLVKSKLGYLTAGTMAVPRSTENVPENTLVLLRPDAETQFVPHDCDIERFWQMEDIGTKEKKSQSKDVTDEEALRQFQETVKFEDGRYHVAWPWRTKEPDLPNNYGLAYGRLQSTMRRLKQDSALLTDYDEIIQKQLDKGVIEEAPDTPDGMVYYLPHHPVIEPHRNTTKIRVVYDASSKSRKDLPSLNDCLLRGMVIMDDLCGLIMRIRLYKVAIISDIEKAFLQVRLQKHERDVGRFLWVKDVDKPPTGKNLVHFRFTSVFFGAISSPFLLGATIDWHLRLSPGEVAKKIRENTYVDNVITGEDSDQDAINHYREAKRLFSGACMNLREFYTNSAQVRNEIAQEDRGTSSDPKVLGIKWNLDEDRFRCPGIKSGECGKLTKRKVTKCMAEIYDPCGWVAPVIVPGKLLIQEMWKLNLAWDENVSDELDTKWSRIRYELAQLPNLAIPRYIGDIRSCRLELHTFGDASQLAIGAVVYLRRIGEKVVNCDLLFAKSRLAPLKPQQTIPRLELVALVTGVNITEFVESQLRLKIDRKVVWSDSQCVLCWLKKERLGTKFVERRVHEIRSKQDVHFRYTPSADNPADLLSRGCSARELQESTKWWHGPSWLSKSEEHWPKDRTQSKVEVDEPESTIQLAAIEVAKPRSIVNSQEYSSLMRLLRVTAFVQRFVRNARVPNDERQTGPLSVFEISKARNYWESLVQAQGFPQLQGNLNPRLLKRSSVSQLNIFRDDNGILRCAGRLDKTGLPYDAQNPVLLSKDHPFTRLIIQRAHVMVGHAGVAQTLTEVRQRYWVIQGRSCVKRVIKQCQRCRRIEGGPYKIPPAPPLPEFRVTSQDQIPFAATGLDYLGFLNVKVAPKTTQKVWVCLFTCAASRAIHLELVENQTAEEFHLALRRFFAVYGCPRLIVSDNASQFIAVESAMNKLWKQLTSSKEVEDLATTRNIEWKKIPQMAPWMGGFYERLVGLVKKLLKKVLDGLCVNLGELRTILAEISAILNSRPLLYVEDDVTSFQVTPASLLGRTRQGNLPTFDETEVPESGAQNTVDKVVSRWKRLQAVTSLFWDQWRQGYLTSLREKHSNAAQRNPSWLIPTVGSVVQIKDKMPRAQWRLGKIEKVFPSLDGKIRSVLVRLASGRSITRPIKLLYPLEMQVEVDKVENVTPYTANCELESGDDEEFWGFSSQDISEVAENLKKHDLAEQMLLNERDQQPGYSDVNQKPPQRKAAKAAQDRMKKATRCPSPPTSWWEDSDDE